MKYIINVFVFIAMLLILETCSSKINEPKEIEEYSYELSKTEAKLQTEILLDETITILLETIAKRTTATKSEFELIKKNNNSNNFYSDGWYIWQDKIYENPFGENNAYNASYVSKILFNKTKPSIADTTKSEFNVHTKFGFLDNSIYGDEVEFEMNTLLLSKPNNAFLTETEAEYKRHWVANYDGEDSDLKYNIYINSENLYYHFTKNHKWLDGIITISMYNYLFTAEVNENSVVKINFYKEGLLIEEYNMKLHSLISLNSLNKQNKNVFPGASTVEEKFIKLFTNVPNSNTNIPLVSTFN